MNLLRRNIDIVFSLADPKKVIDGVKAVKQFRKSDEYSISSRGMSSSYYYTLSRSMDKDYSKEEILCMYDEMKLRSKKYGSIPESLFQLLISFSDSALVFESGIPVCKREKVLSWRSVSLKHGQDLFTCSFLAYRAVIGRTSVHNTFDWPAIIETDDKRLKSMLEKGIAENHFHLVGSSRIFTLSWVTLMNNPEKINYFFNSIFSNKDEFDENRSGRLSFLSDSSHMSWHERLLYAAWIRAKLFKLAYGRDNGNMLSELIGLELRLDMSSEIIREIRALQYQYGILFELPSGDSRCLDYAICDLGSPVDKSSPDRFLCGERELMYRMFLLAFRGQLEEYEQDLFYAYLLLKNNFRSEIIQVNAEVGFANFSLYQDRKDTFWKEIPIYWYEAQRLAVNSAFKSKAMRSLEMRVAPKSSYKENHDLVLGEDEIVLFNDDRSRFFDGSDAEGYTCRADRPLYELTDSERAAKCKGLPFFYVFHFIKRKNVMPENVLFGMISPRNYDTRIRIRKQALELAVTLYESNYLCTRIRGIDAASFEIGCRPETFATEYRFLSAYDPEKTTVEMMDLVENVTPKLGLTYHAGEDFLDITDGLRAIDEAIRFLHLKRSDRIGHALALGVDPEDHYARKNFYVAANKQDMLDNYVWMLKRGRELGISIDHSLEKTIATAAEKLFDEIYGECIKKHGWRVTLEDYYASWKLRGDNPLCYYTMKFEHPYKSKMQFMYMNTISYKYYNSFADSEEYDMYRRNDRICGLVFYYHYGSEERKRGMETCSVRITPDQIELVRMLQDKMQHEVAEKGIVIECNPSSNQLIGTFRRYEKHPIFRFNGHIIDTDPGRINISVSLNTDDQGVFDTSLENEYALIADCMSKIMDDNNHRKYSDDIIYEYLDHIRSIGIINSFIY